MRPAAISAHAPINDSVKHINSNNTLLYADDMAIMDDTAANLTNSLTLLEECCKSNKMKINTKKCKILKFRKGVRLQKVCPLRKLP